MKFIHRLGYYLGGFSIGLILLAFFLSGKKTTCNYAPDARVLDNISKKDLKYSENALENLKLYQLDSIHIAHLINSGDVDFGRSNTDLDSCKTYMITGEAAEKRLEMLMENCDSIATVLRIGLRE